MAAPPGRSGTEVTEVPIEIAATFSGAPAPASAQLRDSRPRTSRRARATRDPGSVALMLLAMLGGLILNLMPCVFPVLSIKAIGLVAQAKTHPAAVRAKGLMFAAGVIASMLALAGVLLAFAGGRGADRLGLPAAVAVVRHIDGLPAPRRGA